MLILGVEDPQGEKTYVAAAFPSACGKTNFAMLIPPDGLRGLEGLDGRRRHRLDQAGRERPAARDQSRRPASSAWRRARPARPTRTRWRRSSRNTIFTNVALTPEGGVWWEGMTDEPPAECLDWQGKRVDAGDRARDRREGRASERALHRARVAVPDHRSGLGRSRRRADQRDHLRRTPRARRCRWSTRRSTGRAGVYIGATMGSETTAAAAGSVGKVRRDPMAMLPFCGYHMGDYFRHWIKMQRALSETPRDLPRELVPQGRRRQVPLARLRREHARAEVDRRSRPRPRAREGNADRLDAALRRHRLDAACDFPESSSTSCRRSTAPRGSKK